MASCSVESGIGLVLSLVYII